MNERTSAGARVDYERALDDAFDWTNLVLVSHVRAHTPQSNGDARATTHARRDSTPRRARTPAPVRPVPKRGAAPSIAAHETKRQFVLVDTVELGDLIEAAVARGLAARGDVERADWLDAAGAAKLLGFHRDTVGRMARRQQLPAARIGREYRFRRSDLLAWIETQRTSR